MALVAMTQPAWAQGPNKDEPPAIKQQQDLRFPQPVRVGTLITWPVITAGGRYRKLGEIIGVFQPTDDDPGAGVPLWRRHLRPWRPSHRAVVAGRLAGRALW